MEKVVGWVTWISLSISKFSVLFCWLPFLRTGEQARTFAGNQQDIGLLPSPSTTAWNKGWETGPNVSGVLTGHNQTYISQEISAAWAGSHRTVPVPLLLPYPPWCQCKIGQLGRSRAGAPFQGWSTVGRGISNGNWNANSSEWRKGPHKSGVTGTQRHHQDAFAQSRDVSYIGENQGTTSAPEINQIHFFLISETGSEVSCLKSHRKQKEDLS